MRKVLLALAILLVSASASAEVIQGALRRAMADTLYCQLAGCTMTGLLNSSSSLRVTGQAVPTSGSGVEVYYTSNTGNVIAFDRTTPAWKPIQIFGSTVALGPSGGTALSIDANSVSTFAGMLALSRGANVASAGTIAPSGQIFHVTGTVTVSTITPPTGFANGCIHVIPDGIFTTNTAGNIALASTTVVGKTLTLCYDGTTTKWYPAY